MAKKLVFRPLAQQEFADDERGVTQDIWLATWGVVAIFLIVVLVLYFTGLLGLPALGGTTGKVVQVPEQRACLKGTAVTSILDANRFIAAGYRCDVGLIPSVRCCYIP